MKRIVPPHIWKGFIRLYLVTAIPWLLGFGIYTIDVGYKVHRIALQERTTSFYLAGLDAPSNQSVLEQLFVDPMAHLLAAMHDAEIKEHSHLNRDRATLNSKHMLDAAADKLEQLLPAPPNNIRSPTLILAPTKEQLFAATPSALYRLGWDITHEQAYLKQVLAKEANAFDLAIKRLLFALTALLIVPLGEPVLFFAAYYVVAGFRRGTKSQ